MEGISYPPYIQHFSHPHQLELISPHILNVTPCSCCTHPASGWMYSCRACNYTLHLSCTQMPQTIYHPSHPGHLLILLPAPKDLSGLFKCDVCGYTGQGFSYHCPECNFDLHILCAASPCSVTHQSHALPLMVSSYPPYQTTGAGGANIMGMPRPVAPQPQIFPPTSHSFPGANQMMQNFQYHATAAGPTQSGIGVVVQGFLTGAANMFGQQVVQSFMNDGNVGNNGDTGVGSSILNGIFGDSMGTQF